MAPRTDDRPELAARNADDEARLEEVLEVIIALASNDLGKRAHVRDGANVLDGIATGLNMLADELAVRQAREQSYQRAIIRAESLAAVGRLAAGTAHEINNPAAHVLLNLASMNERLTEIEKATRHLGSREVEAALADARAIVADNVTGVERIVTMVKRLRAIALLETDRVEPIELHAIAEEACTLVAHQVTYRARLKKDLQPTPAILGDRTKLAQVLTSLLVNAAQAIEEGDPDTNEVEVTTALANGKIVARVRDTGAGIPKDVQARIFEPFFSTKPFDHGVGLGLATSAEIARKHGGELRFQSEVGVGSTFEVWLPLDTGLKETRPVTAPPPKLHTIAAGRPRVLFIDDETALLGAYQRMFGKTLDVTTASSGRAAIAILEKDAEWDAILCDVMMPDLDGAGVLEWLRAHRPALAERIAFCSGGTFTPRSRAFEEALAGRLLEKPLRRAQIEAIVERLRSKRG